MPKKYLVSLTDSERDLLQKLIHSRESKARKLTHARILLKADINETGKNWTDANISEALDVSLSTIARVQKRFATEGLDAALSVKVQQNRKPHRINGNAETHLIAIACSKPPEGHARWSLRLLSDKLVELHIIESVSHETVRQTLKKTNLSLT
jgi:transposase